MKYILIFSFLVSGGLVHANDTLTRAQVYNFSIGDTFEFETSTQTSEIYPDYIPGPVTTSSFRQIIADVYYSSNSDTLFVVKNEGPISFFYSEANVPNAVNYYSDTLVISNLDDYEIRYHYYGSFWDTSYLFSDSLNGRRTNTTICSVALGLSYTEDIFGQGLGIISQIQEMGDGYFRTDLHIALKYYSKGNETWGIPIALGIDEQIKGREFQVTLYPTINSGAFNISFNIIPIETEFKLIDIYGRIVFTSEIQNQSKNISIKDYVPGFYLWTLTKHNKILETGKLIME